MKTAETGTRLTLKNIVFLTDFSEPSEAALPFAVAMAREYGATIHAVHVLTPAAYSNSRPEVCFVAMEAEEETAQSEIERVDARLTGLAHESMVVRGFAIWPTLEQAMENCSADLIVLGTHGRTGAQKFLLGSVAEEIFRRSSVPVLTIGPHVHSGTHSGAKFHRVLFATDFTPESLAAAPYALSLAQENKARLLLLYVVRDHEQRKEEALGEYSVANIMYKLNDLVPTEAEPWCRPETVVEFGDPAERILGAARERGADLIVLGVRGAAGHLGAATHLERTTAHKVVAHAGCPVLTVRG
jgi:nucleotide-binding universal stress UspA family protein